MSARAYRVAPRRRARGRPASRIHWDKLGRVVLVIVLFVVLLSYVNPAVNFIDAWRDSRAQRSELLELRQEHERLAAKAAALEDSDAAVRAARKLGMVAEGERSYVIRGLHDSDTATPARARRRVSVAFVTAPASERTLTRRRVPGRRPRARRWCWRRWPSAPTGCAPCCCRAGPERRRGWPRRCWRWRA